MKRNIVGGIAIMILAFLLVSCGNGAGTASGKTKSITDCAGRTVEIPEYPQKVACLYASAAHIMAMLDEGEKIVGAPNGVKSDVLMQMMYPEIQETATPYQEGSINVEELARIGADLALVRYSTAENSGEVEKLDDMGIPYVVVDYRTMAELNKAISVMGQVFGKENKAEQYLQFSKRTLDLVAKKLKDIPPKDWPNVYHSVNEAIRTDGQGDICGEIMNKAAVKDISIEKGIQSGGDKTYITLEELYRWEPDAIIANECSVTDYILSDSKWEGLSAVKRKAIYTLPVGATRWCHPGSMEAHMGVLAVATMFYPEKFQDLDLAEYTVDYYETCFGLELDDKTIARILTGEGMRISNAPVQ